MARNPLLSMTLVSCLVRVGGNINHVIPPSDKGFGACVVSWPEVLLLREIHGADDAVESIVLVGEAGTTPKAEKARLMAHYDPAVVEHLFPGASPRMEMDMPEGGADLGAQADADLATEAAGVAVPAFRLLGDAAAPAKPTPAVPATPGVLLSASPGFDAAMASAGMSDDVLGDEAGDDDDKPDPALDGGRPARPARVRREA